MTTTDGPNVIDFVETFCRLSKGEYAGKPLLLRDWQKELINDLFELRPDGRRVYRTAYIGLPRKNGKSTLCAALAIYGLIADGEPGAEVYSVAGDRKQAAIVFNEAKSMVQQDPELSELVQVFRDSLYVPSTRSTYRVLSADADLQQGLNPSFVVFDEVHVQPKDDLWEAMTLGSGTRRQPLIVGITTAGYDKESLAYRLYDYGKRVQTGEVDNSTFFFRWWEPKDRDADHLDPKVWAEANPAYGDYLYAEDFETTARTTQPGAFKRFRLNQWTTTKEAWLPSGVWGNAEDDEYIVEDGDDIVLGFDGSYAGDSTALVGCTPDGFLFTVGHWEKPQDDDHWRVDIDAVERTILDACRRWRVREVVCDPFRWQRSMQILEREGVPIVEFPTNSAARMVPACAKFYDAVIDGRIHHDGSGPLARHVGNAVVKVDRLGPRIVKEHKMSSRRIDLAVAAVIAYDRATQAVVDTSSVYEERGLVVL